MAKDKPQPQTGPEIEEYSTCLLYTSDAADD